MDKNKLSIIIPCYNEEKNIPSIVNRLSEMNISGIGEVLLVDNGSTDNSNTVLKELTKPFHYIKVVDVPINKGYGYGILEGLKQASGDVLSWTHADMQTDPQDVLKAYDLYSENLTKYNNEIFIKGRRKNRNKFDEFFTWGMQVIASILLKEPLNDINAQPKLFSRKFYESLVTNAPHDFSLDLYFLYHAKKDATIIDFPVYFAKRLHGEAKGGGSFKGKMKLIKRTLLYMLQIKKEITNENRVKY